MSGERDADPAAPWVSWPILMAGLGILCLKAGGEWLVAVAGPRTDATWLLGWSLVVGVVWWATLFERTHRVAMVLALGLWVGAGQQMVLHLADGPRGFAQGATLAAVLGACASAVVGHARDDRRLRAGVPRQVGWVLAQAGAVVVVGATATLFSSPPWPLGRRLHTFGDLALWGASLLGLALLVALPSLAAAIGAARASVLVWEHRPLPSGGDRAAEEDASPPDEPSPFGPRPGARPFPTVQWPRRGRYR